MNERIARTMRRIAWWLTETAYRLDRPKLRLEVPGRQQFGTVTITGTPVDLGNPSDRAKLSVAFQELENELWA